VDLNHRPLGYEIRLHFFLCCNTAFISVQNLTHTVLLVSADHP
jgi:hypothetical protein